MSEVHDIVWSISVEMVDASLRTAWHQSVRYEKATFPHTITFHFATSICGLFVLVAETSVTWLCFTTGRRLTPFYQGDQLIVRKTSIAPPTQEYHFPIGSFTGSIAEQSKLTEFHMPILCFCRFDISSLNTCWSYYDIVKYQLISRMQLFATLPTSGYRQVSKMYLDNDIGPCTV